MNPALIFPVSPHVFTTYYAYLFMNLYVPPHLDFIREKVDGMWAAGGHFIVPTPNS
jgi:hypothetical protein